MTVPPPKESYASQSSSPLSDDPGARSHGEVASACHCTSPNEVDVDLGFGAAFSQPPPPLEHLDSASYIV